jgi:pimeloyl-ACP methyl ester carboxylesterase
MPRRARRAVSAAALAATVAALASAPAASAQELRCPEGARCATLSVPLDHSGGTPGTQPVAYAVLPATGTRTGTLVFLAGGPGEAAIPLARVVATELRRLRGSYDLVLVDQRGTGASGAVECELESQADVTACGERLGARRAFMSTRETALDLEDVRAALGAEQLTLLGVSYGATVAQAYARLFPQRTAALVLDSPTPVDGLDAIFQLRQLGLGRALREICQPGACKLSLPRADQALDRLAARLRRGAMRGRVVLPSGRTRRVSLTEAELYGLVLRSDVDPSIRADLPGAIGSGATGDPGPLLRLAGFVERAPGQEAEPVNLGRLLATSCIEGRLPWSPDAPVAGRGAALNALLTERRRAFAPFSTATVRDETSATLCTGWPATPAPAPVSYGGPDVPVLVLAGREDLRTPLEDARRTAEQYPNAKLLPVPDVGHSVIGTDPTTCAITRTAAFLAGAEIDYCVRRARPLAPLPVIPAGLDDFRGRGDAKRTANAVAASLFAVLREIASVQGTRRGLRFPALRAGVFVAYRDRVELRGVEWVRGVRLTGVVRRRSARIVIGGSRATPGVIAGRPGRPFRGTIGGRRVVIRP